MPDKAMLRLEAARLVLQLLEEARLRAEPTNNRFMALTTADFLAEADKVYAFLSQEIA